MIEESISSVTAKFEKDISKVQQEELKNKLGAVSDDKYDSVSTVKTKSLLLTTILSALLGLFGAGSFYLGLLKRGICKVVFNIALPLLLGIVMLYWFAPLHKDYSIQANDMYVAVTANEDYDYSLENLLALQLDYNKVYKSFDISDDESCLYELNTQYKNLVAVNDYLSEEKDNVKVAQSRYDSFISKLNSFAQHSSIAALKTEIGNTLAIVDGLANEEEKAEYESYYQLADKLDIISTAKGNLATVEVEDYNDLIKEVVPKLKALIDARTFEDISSCASALITSLEAVDTDYSSLYNELSKNLAIVLGDSSEIVNLEEQIKDLNLQAFILQTVNDANTVNEASKTDLAIALNNFDDAYTQFNKDEVAENKNVSDFIAELQGKLNIQLNLKSIKSKGAEAKEYSESLEYYRDRFVAQNQEYLEYLNSEYAVDLKDTAVDKKVTLNKTLAEVCSIMDKLAEDNDIDSVYDEISEVASELSVLQTRASEAAWDYKFDYKFVNLFFATLLVIDGIIIVAYWIFEIFRNRERCQNINYENIKKSLN